MRSMITRWFTIASAAMSFALPVAAQEAWPARAIRIIVPFAPGGATDIMARLFGKVLGESIGQSVVIENKPGGGTVIGTELAVRARADGYTIIIVSAPIATNPGLMASLPYDALRDLAPVINVSAQGFLITVNDKQPYKTLADLLAAARRPDVELPYASPGNGTLMHLVGQVFNAEYQTRFLHIPYKGSGPALQDAMSGQVPVFFDAITSSMGAVQQGRLRVLAVTNPTRLRALPEVPTVRELGYPRAEATAFSGFMVPAGTPAAIVQRLNAEFNKALASAEVQDRLVAQMGGTLIGGTAQEFGNLLRTETERWVPLIRRLGLKAN
ncbi:MAG: Bug family tripartite tricarboxylate transporter substrate binding protein [Burkholderiales bacterium]